MLHEPMRVIFVAALPPERSSMVGRILPLARAVQHVGHAVTIYTLSGGTDTEVGPLVRTVGPNIRASDERSPSPLAALHRWRAGLRGLRTALASERPDVVVLAKPQLQNTPPALELAARTGARLVLDADDLEAESSRLPWPLRLSASALERRAARSAAIITACSPFLVDYYRRLTADALMAKTSDDGRGPTSDVPTRVELLPTGIEIRPSVPPARLRERLGLPPNAKIILYVGSLSIASGHRIDLLLKAFNEIASSARPPGSLFAKTNGVHLVLAGGGIDTERLQAVSYQLSAVSSRVHFIGRFTPPEDFALAREADLLVDPVDGSRTNQAKSSHRVMLAFATGTPIVTGRVGIRPFLLPSSLHADCLYDPTDSAHLATAFRNALMPGFADRFRRETEGRITQWTWETLGRQFVQLVEQS